MQFSEETALVNHIEGNFVFLETKNNGSCGNCHSKSGCGNLSSVFTLQVKNKLRVSNTLNLKEGDAVIVGMPAEKLLIATALMYVLPLILLFSLALITKVYLGETASILAGLVGLVGGLLLVNKITQIDSITELFQPKLIRKVINVDGV